MISSRKRVDGALVLRNALGGLAFDALEPREQHMALNIIQNASLMRSELLNKLIDPRRDIDLECGYPKNITTEQYKLMYDREGVATRSVRIFPEESWALDPEISEDEKLEQTKFEEAWETLQEERNIWAFLFRADEISGIGRFGILLLGFDDGKKLSDPVEGISEKGEKVGDQQQKLLYLRTFDESLVTVKSKETDRNNPRFGQPLSYSITFEATSTVRGDTAVSITTQEQVVHWSRVIHLADNRKSSEVFGTPRMQILFNRLYDIRKIAGGSGEMFWKGAFPGYSFEVVPELQGATLDADALRTEFENYSNGLQRYLALQGVTAKSLLPQMGDPTDHVDTQLKLIAISLGVPFRIFMGSEQAKLASTQDKDSWNKRVDRRRTKYLTPHVIRPFVDRMIAVGVLPEPKEYFVFWPDLSAPTRAEKSEVLERIAKALALYVEKGVEMLIPPKEFLMMFVGLDEAEVQQIMDSTLKQQDQMSEEEEQAAIAAKAAEEQALRQAAEEEAARTAAAAAGATT